MRRITVAGFSLVELLASLAIIGAICAVSLAAFANFNRREAALASSSALAAALRDARARTLASVAGSQYGVKVDTDRFTFFQGATFASTTAGNNTFLYGAGVRASSSISTFVFERVTGNSSASGTIDIYQPSPTAIVRHVRVQTTGLVSIE